MLNDTNINELTEKVEALQASVNSVAEMLTTMQKDRLTFGDWVPEHEVMTITGLSKATLLKLRNGGKLSSSTISGKQIYYRLSSIKKLLDRNEQET